MQLLLAIVLIAAAAAYVTSIPCRLLLARRRCASWFVALAGALTVGILTVLVVYQGDVFHPARWDRGKAPLEMLMALAFVSSSVVGLIPALLVVGHFRKRVKNEMHFGEHSR